MRKAEVHIQERLAGILEEIDNGYRFPHFFPIRLFRPMAPREADGGLDAALSKSHCSQNVAWFIALRSAGRTI